MFPPDLQTVLLRRRVTHIIFASSPSCVVVYLYRNLPWAPFCPLHRRRQRHGCVTPFACINLSVGFGHNSRFHHFLLLPDSPDRWLVAGYLRLPLFYRHDLARPFDRPADLNAHLRRELLSGGDC